MHAPVKPAYVYVAAAGEIHIPLAAVARDVSLRVVVKPALARAHLKGVHIVVKFYTLPAAAVVIFVPYKECTGPVAGKAHLEGLVAVRVNEFREQSVAWVREEFVCLRQAAHTPQRMDAVAVVNRFVAAIAQRHIKVKIVARGVVVVHIYAHREPVHPTLVLPEVVAGRLCRFLGEGAVAEAHRHLAEAVAVVVVENEWVLPLVAEVFHHVGLAVGLEEGGIAAVVGVEVAYAVLLPAPKLHRIPVDIVEDAVAVVVKHIHKVNPAVLAAVWVVYHQLNVRHAVAGLVCVFNNKVVDAVLVAVHQQAVVHNVALNVARLHIAVLVQPQDGDVAADVALYGVLPSVVVEVQEFGPFAHRHAQRHNAGVDVPIWLRRHLQAGNQQCKRKCDMLHNYIIILCKTMGLWRAARPSRLRLPPEYQ